MESNSIFLFTVTSGIASLLICIGYLQPKISQHLRERGTSVSELMSEPNRDMFLSLIVALLAVIKIFLYLGLLALFNFSPLLVFSVFLLVTSSICLLMTDLLSLNYSRTWHNFFARAYVILQMVGSLAFGISQINGSEIQFQVAGLIIIAGVIALGFRLVKKSHLEDFSIRAIANHMLFLYLFFSINLILLIQANLT